MSGLVRRLAERAMNRGVSVRSQTACLQWRWQRESADGPPDEFAPPPTSAASVPADFPTHEVPHVPKRSLRTPEEPVPDEIAAVRAHAAPEPSAARAAKKQPRTAAQEPAMPAPARPTEKSASLGVHRTATPPPPLVALEQPEPIAPRRSADASSPPHPARLVRNVPEPLVRDEDARHEPRAAAVRAMPGHAAAPAAPAPLAIGPNTRRKEATHDAAPTEVHVSIGRIELVAPAPPAAARTVSPRAARSTVSLADYLRGGGGRRP